MDQAYTKQKLKELRALVDEGDRVAIVLQDDPDPDAMASAMALRTLLGRNKLTTPLFSFKPVTRPENRTMVHLLEIDIEPAETAELDDAETPLATPTSGGITPGGKPGVVRAGPIGLKKQTVQVAVAVSDGGTVVIRTGSLLGGKPKPAQETLWVLTAHVIRTEKQPAAPTPAANSLLPATEGTITPLPVPPVPPAPAGGR